MEWPKQNRCSSEDHNPHRGFVPHRKISALQGEDESTNEYFLQSPEVNSRE